MYIYDASNRGRVRRVVQLPVLPVCDLAKYRLVTYGPPPMTTTHMHQNDDTDPWIAMTPAPGEAPLTEAVTAWDVQGEVCTPLAVVDPRSITMTLCIDNERAPAVVC